MISSAQWGIQALGEGTVGQNDAEKNEVLRRRDVPQPSHPFSLPNATPRDCWKSLLTRLGCWVLVCGDKPPRKHELPFPSTTISMPVDSNKPLPTRRAQRKITEEELKDIELKRIRGKLASSLLYPSSSLTHCNHATLGELSCAECRRLKLRCDKKVPCGSCMRRGCESICPCGE